MLSSENYKPQIKPQQTALNKQWQAKQQKALSLANTVVNEPAKLSVLEMNLTISEVFTKPTIRQAFKGNELGTVIYGVVNSLLNRFLEAFAFTQKLTKSQIDILTVSTLENFEYETLEDVILFFKMARMGQLGVAKKSVDANLLFGEWLPIYLEKKATEREVYLNKKRQEYMDNSAEAMKFYERQKAKKEAERKKQEFQNYINELTKDMDRQMLEDMIFDWQKDPKRRPYVNELKKKRKEIK